MGWWSTIEIGIWDDDFLTIDAVPPVTEGSNNAVTEVPVTVRFAYPQPVPVDVELGTDPEAQSSDTATEVDDWVIATFGLTFATGQTSARLIVQIAGDNMDEPDEFFTLLAQSFDDRSWQSVSTMARTVVTIVDDDGSAATARPSATASFSSNTFAPPTPTFTSNTFRPGVELAIEDSSEDEGDPVPFGLTLSEPYSGDISIYYNIVTV